MNGKRSGSANRWISRLTLVQHATTPFISIFLAVHLVAPISALVGGSSAASGLMLLGREYYQTPLGEPLLVWIPMGLHVCASMLKRALIGFPTRLNALQATSISLAWFFIPIHLSVHRFIPSSPMPPISELRPSQLDYEYVKTGIHVWPLTSWFLYAGLVVSMAIHALDGGLLMYRSRFPTPEPPKGSKTLGGLAELGPKAVAVAIVLSVLGGVSVLSTEASYATSALAARIQASYLQSFFFRWTAR
ncbi:uncharacterized protein EI90DRAFT_3149513 [Cantharellus anzutake]|uniref:uncharacterized protein n=1 Tax=Cantharellus anzutake TaxID=1750568 RepID=UPI001905F784|nr:uncharacterized protein EI90DRAFT_3149513 [Cantharellus anzutake]KAF8344076.1 hypothetical protein EI90DRAFT_3149513 [Cantharellus anzutake]